MLVHFKWTSARRGQIPVIGDWFKCTITTIGMHFGMELGSDYGKTAMTFIFGSSNGGNWLLPLFIIM